MTNKIDRLIELGLVDEANSLLVKWCQKEDNNQWLDFKQSEYDLVYPSTRLMTETEWNNINKSDLTWNNLTAGDKAELIIVIDYENDNNYLTFSDWLTQTKTVLIGTEIATDDDGVEYEKEIFEEQIIIAPFQPKDNYDIEVEDYLNNSPIYLTQVQLSKKAEIGNIIVTLVSGKRIYADPISRLDLSDVIMEAMEASVPDDYLISWKTVDGIMDVAISELKEARKLGLEAKAKIIGVN